MRPYLVKRKHLPGHLSSIVQSNSHSIVNLDLGLASGILGTVGVLGVVHTRFCYKAQR